MAAPAPENTANPFPQYKPETTIAMDLTSSHYYTENPQANECRKMKEPEKYGDKNSFFKVTYGLIYIYRAMRGIIDELSDVLIYR